METFIVPVIETGIPLPDRFGGGKLNSAKRLKFAEILSSMKPGDSVLLANKRDVAMMHTISRKLDARVMSRAIFHDGGKMFRLWRVEGNYWKGLKRNSGLGITVPRDHPEYQRQYQKLDEVRARRREYNRRWMAKHKAVLSASKGQDSQPQANGAVAGV